MMLLRIVFILIAFGLVVAVRADELADYIELFKNDSIYVRREAARQLAKMPPEQVLPALARVKKDGDVRLRSAAVTALGKLAVRQRKAYPELVEALFDESREVRVQAESFLSVLPEYPKEMLPALVKVMQGDYEDDLRSNIAVYFGKMGPEGEKAIGELEEALHDRAISVRYNAAWSIWELHGKVEEVVPTFVHNLSVEEVIPLLPRNLSVTDDVPAFSGSLSADDDFFRFASASMLARIGPSAIEAVPALVKALQDKSPRVRSEAANALAAIGSNTPTVKAALEVAVKDTEAVVRESAEAALKRLK